MSESKISSALLAEIKFKAGRTPPGPVWHKEEGVNYVRNKEGWRISTRLPLLTYTFPFLLCHDAVADDNRYSQRKSRLIGW